MNNDLDRARLEQEKQDRLRREREAAAQQAKRKQEEDRENENSSNKKKKLTEEEIAEQKRRDARADAVRSMAYAEVSKKTIFTRSDNQELPPPTLEDGSALPTLSTDQPIKVDKFPDGWYVATDVQTNVKKNIFIADGKVSPYGDDMGNWRDIGAWKQVLLAYKGGLGVNDVTLTFGREAKAKDIDLKTILKIIEQGIETGVAVRIDDPKLQERLALEVKDKKLCDLIREKSAQSVQAVSSNEAIKKAQDEAEIKFNASELKTNAGNLSKTVGELEKIKPDDKEAVDKIKAASGLVEKTKKSLENVSKDLGKTTADSAVIKTCANAVAEAERAMTSAQKTLADNKEKFKGKAEFTQLNADVEALSGRIAEVAKTASINAFVPEKRFEQKNAILTNALDTLDKAAKAVAAAPADQKEAKQADFSNALKKTQEAVADLGSESNKKDTGKQIVLVEGAIDKAIKKVEDIQAKNTGLFTDADRGVAKTMEATLKQVETVSKPEKAFNDSLDKISKATDPVEKAEMIQRAKEAIMQEVRVLKETFVHYEKDPAEAGVKAALDNANPNEDMARLESKKDRVEDHMKKVLDVVPAAEKDSFKKVAEDELKKVVNGLKEKMDQFAKKSPTADKNQDPARPGGPA